MQDFSIGTMRKDLRFLDDAIVISNKSKKEATVLQTPALSKKIKNLRYFLRKKRNIMFKHSPSGVFSRSHLNTTYFDTSSGQDKHVIWTVELIFLKRNQSSMGDFSPFYCETLAQVVLNHEHMIHEETSLGSFISKAHLKKSFFNQDLSLLVTSLSDEDFAKAPIYLKRSEPNSLLQEEEGEISTIISGRAKY
jgi:hypothetical protein